MALAMTWRALDDRVAVRDARLLRRLRNAVHIGPKRNHRLARTPPRRPCRRNAGDAAFNPETFLLENARQVLLRLEFLEPELAVAEHLVNHLLREVAHALDVGDGLLL